MRNEYDFICFWVFDKDLQILVFIEGIDKMDCDDMYVSFMMFYKEMGWDLQFGCLICEILQCLGLEDIVVDLVVYNLLFA